MTIALPVCPSFTGKAFHLMPMQKQKPLLPKKGYRAAKRFFRSMGYNRRWTKIESRFLGEAHTKDNIVTWIPSEHILFGGCQVKSLGSAKGNLADANVDAWSETTRRIKAAYKDVKDRCTGAWGCRHNRTPGLHHPAFWPRKAGIISAAYFNSFRNRLRNEIGCPSLCKAM